MSTPRKVIRLSPSAVRAFRGCPYRYARDYIRRLPDKDRVPMPSLGYGSAIHGALADFFRKGAWERQTKDSLVSALVRRWDGSMFPDKETELVRFHIARDMLERYFDDAYPEEVEQELGVERYVAWRAPFNGMIAAGRIDRAVLKPGRVVEVIDFKTNSWVPTHQEVKDDVQALFYRTLAADAYGPLEPEGIQVTFYNLIAGAAVTVELTREEFDRRWLPIELIADQVREGLEDFEEGKLPLDEAFPLRRGLACTRCPMQKHCDALSPVTAHATSTGRQA